MCEAHRLPRVHVVLLSLLQHRRHIRVSPRKGEMSRGQCHPQSF
jgi:hypothetical protein